MHVDGVQRATFECLGLHFDTRAGKTAAMSDEAQASLRQAGVAELPDWAGRSVANL